MFESIEPRRFAARHIFFHIQLIVFRREVYKMIKNFQETIKKYHLNQQDPLQNFNSRFFIDI